MNDEREMAPLNEDELRLVQDRSIFRMKAVVTEKVKQQLMQLRDGLREDVAMMNLLAPEGLDVQDGQLVKGEHLMDFPYLYLDFPKYFSQGDTFTFRTLFWWGHHSVFALILDGRDLDRYKDNLLNAYDRLADQGLYLLMTETPWEWRRGSDYVLEIAQGNRAEVTAAVKARPFLKIHRYLDFHDPVVAKGGVITAGRESFKLMARIASR